MCLGRAQSNLAKLLLEKALLLKRVITCFLLLKIRHGAHQSRKKHKCFRACFGTFSRNYFPIDLCGGRKCYFIWYEDIYSFKKQLLPPNENNLKNVICFIIFLLIECLQIRLFSIFVFDFSKKYHSSTAILSFYWTIVIKQTKMLLLSVEAKMLCLKANLIRAKALLSKAALLDWSAPGLRCYKVS